MRTSSSACALRTLIPWPCAGRLGALHRKRGVRFLRKVLHSSEQEEFTARAEKSEARAIQYLASRYALVSRSCCVSLSDFPFVLEHSRVCDGSSALAAV